MSFPVRVLVVDEDGARAEQLVAACVESVDAEVVASVGDGARLAEEDFDLVVHGLGELDLLRTIGAEHPGIPLVVLGDSAEPATINELLAVARKEDHFGVDREEPMVSFYSRDAVEECAAGLRELVGRIAEVASIPVELEPPLELAASEVRAIQIFVRRTEAERARVTGLSGGLSGQKTLIVEAADAGGMRTAQVVGKLAPVKSIPAAVDGYEDAIPYLPAGLGAALAGVVTAGAANTGAVFYRLADDYRRSYFDCLAESPADAAEAVRSLHRRFADDHARAPIEPETVASLRRSVVPDEWFADMGIEVPSLPEDESTEVQVARAIQHRDLHGLNVLVSDSNEPLLIDYDSFGRANCAIDPITLELSAIFHRDEGVQSARGAWPVVEQARRWHHVDAFLEGCPFPEPLRACRAWAEDSAASPVELSATLLAIAMRQLTFENTDKDLARALIEAGREGMRAQ